MNDFWISTPITLFPMTKQKVNLALWKLPLLCVYSLQWGKGWGAGAALSVPIVRLPKQVGSTLFTDCPPKTNHWRFRHQLGSLTHLKVHQMITSLEARPPLIRLVRSFVKNFPIKTTPFVEHYAPPCSVESIFTASYKHITESSASGVAGTLERLVRRFCFQWHIYVRQM